MYGKIVNGQLIINKTKESGDKPVVYVDPPQIDENSIAWFSFVEQEESIRQMWHIAPNEYDNADLSPYGIEAKAEAFDILMGVTP